MTIPQGRAAGRVSVAGAVALAATLACFRITEYDVCWHLRAGEWILAQGEVPRADPFSHTVHGKPWIDFEWLAQAAFHVLAANGGLDALIAFKMALTGGAFLLAAASGRRLGAPPLPLAGILLLAALVAHERFFSRPDMFTHFGVALTVLAHLELARGRARLALALPALQAVWVNLHGGFVMGPLLGAAFAAGAWLNGRTRTPERDAVLPPSSAGATLRSSALAAACAAACLANPYGLRGVLYPFTEVPVHPGGRGTNVFLESIAEWQSPFASAEFGHPMAMAFYAWTALWASVLLARPGSVDFRGVCVFLGTFVLAASARRHTAIHAVATAPFLAAALWRLGRDGGRIRGLPLAAGAWAAWTAARGPHPPPVLAILLLPFAIPMAAGLASRPWARRAAAAALIAIEVQWACWIASDRFQEAYDGGRRFGFGASTAFYPEGAVRYLERHQVYGRMFNNLSAGGYLAWRAPQHPVFVDGRNLLYGEAFYREYMEALTSQQGWRRLVERYGITVALLGLGELGDFLPRMASENPDWRMLYADHVSRLYVRRTLATEALLARLPPGVEHAPVSSLAVGPPGGALCGLATSVQRLLRTAPGLERYEDAGRVQLALCHGDLAGASRAYASLLAREPGNLRARLDLAGLYERMGMLAMAEDAVREVLAGGLRHRWDGKAAAHSLLGTLLLRQGRMREAEAEYALADPTDPGPPNNRGIRMCEEGRHAEAVPLLERAVALSPSDPDLLCNLAAALQEAGRDREALDALLKAFEIAPRGSRAGRMLADRWLEAIRKQPSSAFLAARLAGTYRGMGEKAAAGAWYRRALALDPAMTEAQEGLEAIPGMP